MTFPLAFILLWPTLHDGHQAPIPCPELARVTIANVAESRYEAAALYVLGAHESGWHMQARGDSGRSCGTFQTPCARTPMDGPELGRRQALVALQVLRTAIDRCPEHPVWMYASGRCAPSPIAIRYEAEIRVILDMASTSSS